MRTRSLLSFALISILTLASHAAGPADVVPAINALGLDLYRQQVREVRNEDVLLSPYSIATALAMMYAGAGGATKDEMARVLRFPADTAACSRGFQLLREQFEELVADSARSAAGQTGAGENVPALTLRSANRVYLQEGFQPELPFLQLMSESFGVAPGTVDFRGDPESARNQINQWVAECTENRIPRLLAAGQPAGITQAVLVNTLYLKAAWAAPFLAVQTKPLPFHLSLTREDLVPTMFCEKTLHFAQRSGYSIVTLPYQTGRLQFVLFVPDAIDGLAGVENDLTPELLIACTNLDRRDLLLYLPKFKLEPGTQPLAGALQAIGLHSALDQPAGTADFTNLARRTSADRISLGEIFHQTWLSLDERGTEAAAATQLRLSTFGVALPPPQPVVLRADRPFLFAIQHIHTGVCLFLGRVTDPRAN